MTIQFIISFNAKTEQLNSFKTILETVKSELPSVEGCVGVDVFNQASDENKFTLIETWETQKQHETHVSNLVENGSWGSIASHLASEPVSAYFVKM